MASEEWNRKKAWHLRKSGTSFLFWNWRGNLSGGWLWLKYRLSTINSWWSLECWHCIPSTPRSSVLISKYWTILQPRGRSSSAGHKFTLSARTDWAFLARNGHQCQTSQISEELAIPDSFSPWPRKLVWPQRPERTRQSPRLRRRSQLGSRRILDQRLGLWAKHRQLLRF